MLNKPSACQNCVLGHYKNSGFSNPEGACKNGVLIVGEGLGVNEVQDGLPFRPYAESGSALQTAIGNLKKFGINQERSDFGFWNIIGCQPPYNKLLGMKYEEDAVSTCKANYFDKVIEFYKPKVILALGGLPVKWLVPEIKRLQDELLIKIEDAKILKDKEQIKYLNSQMSKLYISALRGYRFDSIYGIPLVASFHPSYVTRTGRILLGVLLRDLMFALEVAKGDIKEYEFKNYIENPSIEEAKQYYNECKNNKDLVISYDIETPFTKLQADESEVEFDENLRDINSIQFSIPINNNGTIETKSIFLDWNENYLDIIKDILLLPNNKVGHNNWKFDETNLKYHLGQDAINGTRYDTIWLWKHFNADFRILGKALQFAANFYIPNLPAWKHTSESNPRHYGLVDVDVTLKLFLGLKKELSAAKSPLPKSKTLFEGYEDDIVKLFPILQAMSKRGFPINLKAREEFKQELEVKRAEVLEELQEEYPTVLRRPDPKLGYKVVPPIVGELETEFNNKYCNPSSKDYTIFLDQAVKNLALSRFIESKTRRDNEEIKKDVLGQTGLVVREFELEDKSKVKRYCRLDRFKPSSKDQVATYIRYKGYKIKVKRDKKGSRETTDKNALYELFEETKDGFLLKASYERELAKIIRTYIDGWKTDAEGRVHSTFLPLPATGQLSATNPNVQNSPLHGNRFNSKDYVEMARKFRSTIQPKEGHTLLSFDYTGFHAIMLGVEAEDDTYIRLAKLDIHSFLAANMIRDEYTKKRSFDIKALKGNLTKSEADKLRDETLERIKDLDKWLSYSDDELSINLEWIKKNHKLLRDAQAKPAVHGVGFGMGVKKFYTLNKHAFTNAEQPRKILMLLKRLFPKVFKWQDYIKNLAHEQTYLLSRYGYIRRFWDVYDFRLLTEFRPPKSEYEKIFEMKDGKVWSRTDGGQVKEAIAFLPANNAFGKKKEAMRDLEDRDLNNKYRLILDNHDELLFECPDEFLDEAIPVVKETMESKARHISTGLYPNGISCPISIKLGKDWSNMKGIKI